MRLTIKILFFMLVFVFAANGQNGAENILSPSADDLAAAKEQGVNVFKILPRGMLDSDAEKNELKIRGGGAYYSFVKKSHSYDEIPQLELQQGKLMVGFAGADYGLIADLGDTALASVNRENKMTDFLFNYKPKNIEAEAREEFVKTREGLENDGLKYKRKQPAVVGRTYILRAISYDQADTLVAFQVHRKETDGSLIIFWKLLRNFEKPVLIRADQNASMRNADIVSVGYSGSLAARIEERLKKRGFTKVKVSEDENKMIVLEGTVPKGKIADAIQLALESSEGKPVKNRLTEEK